MVDIRSIVGWGWDVDNKLMCSVDNLTRRELKQIIKLKDEIIKEKDTRIRELKDMIIKIKNAGL